ncbi:hypothetical protein CCHR01_11970 [Colletotrichum chrysophilum]|uniref:Uncharacterized protein n=1 Tax=Colletotrichum chrysophilum TaxID=1836956 RepID=A0AAD9ADJ9_9PEZI|nr:hypothetical protein CCHR01_11970 [Colletotrichum chrysophilum]
MGERTGSRVLQWVWPYVFDRLSFDGYVGCPGGRVVLMCTSSSRCSKHGLANRSQLILATLQDTPYVYLRRGLTAARFPNCAFEMMRMEKADKLPQLGGCSRETGLGEETDIFGK